MECADVLLRGTDEADQSERVPAIHRGVQLVEEGLHLAGISERAKVKDTSGLLEGDLFFPT